MNDPRVQEETRHYLGHAPWEIEVPSFAFLVFLICVQWLLVIAVCWP